jgi:putative oxidoreductase
MTTLREVRARLRVDRWELVALRLMVGFGFAFHGYAKLDRGPDHFGAILAAMGIPAPTFTAWVTALVELAGGIALMVGAFVAIVSVPLAVIMATALFGVHLQYGFSSVRLKAFGPAGAEFGPIGYELNLLYIVALVALATGGASRLSFDRWRARRKGGRA